MNDRLLCVVLDDYQQASIRFADWTPLRSRIDVEILTEHIAERQILQQRLGEAAILVVNRERTQLDARLLASLPKLRLIVTTGMVNAAVDMDAAAELGIVVCGTGSAGNSAAEMTWALILGLSRHLVREATNLRSGGRWQLSVGLGLAGRTLGLVGFGRVGRQVARVGAAFEMRLLAWTPRLTPEGARPFGVEAATSIEEVFGQSDVVSIHAPLNGETRGMVGTSLIGRMKSEALLVNTARGPIVDEIALVQALRLGRIAGAALDVFDEEPLALDHPFRKLDNVLATPHIGYVVDSTYRRFFTDVVEDIAAWLSGEPVRLLSGPRHPAG